MSAAGSSASARSATAVEAAVTVERVGTVEPDARTDRSLGELFAMLTVEVSDLVHDQIALGKAEMRQEFKKVTAGGGSFGAAGVLVLFSLPVLSFAAAYGIHGLGLGLGWSFLIVGGVYLLVAGALALVGTRSVKRITGPQRSIESTKKTVATFKGVKPHPAPAEHP